MCVYNIKFEIIMKKLKNLERRLENRKLKWVKEEKKKEQSSERERERDRDRQRETER